jgi:hypothetical protein
MIVTSIIYQQLIMTPNATDLFIFSRSLFTHGPYRTILAEVIIYPGGQGEEAYCRFFFLINFLGPLFILWPYSIIFTEVTIYPERFTALFWIVPKPLFTLGL